MSNRFSIGFNNVKSEKAEFTNKYDVLLGITADLEVRIDELVRIEPWISIVELGVQLRSWLLYYGRTHKESFVYISMDADEPIVVFKVIDGEWIVYVWGDEY